MRRGGGSVGAGGAVVIVVGGCAGGGGVGVRVGEGGRGTAAAVASGVAAIGALFEGVANARARETEEEAILCYQFNDGPAVIGRWWTAGTVAGGGRTRHTDKPRTRRIDKN